MKITVGRVTLVAMLALICLGCQRQGGLENVAVNLNSTVFSPDYAVECTAPDIFMAAHDIYKWQLSDREVVVDYMNGTFRSCVNMPKGRGRWILSNIIDVATVSTASELFSGNTPGPPWTHSLFDPGNGLVREVLSRSINDDLLKIDLIIGVSRIYTKYPTRQDEALQSAPWQFVREAIVSLFDNNEGWMGYAVRYVRPVTDDVPYAFKCWYLAEVSRRAAVDDGWKNDDEKRQYLEHFKKHVFRYWGSFEQFF